MQQTRPILIVGSGPTGMTAAMELSRLGIPIRIIDKLQEFSGTSRALAVQARTLELFQQRGLTPEMLRIGNPGRAATLYADAKELGKVDLSLIHSRYDYILMLAQSETERILREQLTRQGVAIERGTTLIALGEPEAKRDGDFLSAVLRKSDGTLEEVESSYLIAAEGAHSLVRHTLQLSFPGKSLSHAYALADLHVEGPLPDDELSIFLAEQGLMAIFPMGKRRFRLIATEPDSTGDGASPDLATMQRLYDASSHIPVRLHDMEWSSHFRINSRMLAHLRHGRIFFGGDAAHIHSPAGGQGMNTGIQDMINLSWKLALVYRGLASDALLDTYGAERLPIIQGIVSTTERATDLFNSESPFVHTLLEHVAPLLLRSSTVQRTSAGMLSEVEASYRRSSLSGKGHSDRGSIRAGDRLPDWTASCHDARGASLAGSTLDILDPSRFTLLLAPGNEAPAELAAALAYEDVGVVRTMDVPNEGTAARACYEALMREVPWLLVRPDGYVALIGSAAGSSEASEWLERWLPNVRSAQVQDGRSTPGR